MTDIAELAELLVVSTNVLSQEETRRVLGTADVADEGFVVHTEMQDKVGLLLELALADVALDWLRIVKLFQMSFIAFVVLAPLAAFLATHSDLVFMQRSMLCETKL